MWPFTQKQKLYISGTLDDTRTLDEKLGDYQFEEMVATAEPVNWVEKSPATWRKFPIRSQDGSGSCVAQTMAKLLGILRYLQDGVFVEFSASDLYNRRSNPGAGMIGVEAFNLVRKYGLTLEVLMPSQNMSEAEIAKVKRLPYMEEIGGLFKIDNYVQLPFDIETIASVIQKTGKGVMVWVKFNTDEWTDVPQIKTDKPQYGHSVTAVDFTLWKGEKALVIDDSWGKFYGFNGQRVLTETFLKKRIFFCAYPINFKTSSIQLDSQKPVYHFTKELSFSPLVNYDPDVVALQKILRYEGLYPTNIDCTGYYGAITAKAVLDWQIKHNVAPLEELQQLKGRVCGQKTIAKLNELYSNS